MRWHSLVVVSLMLGCQADPTPEDAEVCETVHNGSATLGDACSKDGAQCSYGDDCGSETYVCQNGVWTAAGCSDCGCDDTTESGETTSETTVGTAEGPPDTGDTSFPECYPDQIQCAMDCCDPNESCIDDVCVF